MMYNTKNPLEVQNLRLKIEKLIEKQSMVEVLEKKAKTLQQLKYLHTILAYFGLQTGNTLDEVKTCYFKRIDIPSSEEYIALLHIQHDIEQNKHYL